MLTFIIPLQSKATAKDWVKVCRLFERCVRSISQQTSPAYQIIVVCNEEPDIELKNQKINYLKVDFPPPETGMDKEKDKSKRILTGLFHARTYGPSHIMIVDADDCVSCRLAEFVDAHTDSAGWYVNKGYVYSEGSRLIYYRKSSFYLWCNTSLIAKSSILNIPRSQEELGQKLPDFFWNHKDAKNKGYGLNPLPFPGTVYIIGTGENMYQSGFRKLHNANWHKPIFRLKDTLNYRFLTPSIKGEFGLYPLISHMTI